MPAGLLAHVSFIWYKYLYTCFYIIWSHISKLILTTEKVITATLKVISATTKVILTTEEVFTATLKVI